MTTNTYHQQTCDTQTFKMCTPHTNITHIQSLIPLGAVYPKLTAIKSKRKKERAQGHLLLRK